MSTISPDIVTTYSPRGALPQKDLIEIGKKLPMNFIAKCIKIILETFNFSQLFDKTLSGYFANRAVEAIAKYNYQFFKDHFIPTEEMLASVKGYLKTHPTAIIDFNTELYKKIDEICRAHDLIKGVQEGDSFLIKAYDLSTEKEKSDLIRTRINKIELNRRPKSSQRPAKNKVPKEKSLEIKQPAVQPELVILPKKAEEAKPVEKEVIQFVEIQINELPAGENKVPEIAPEEIKLIKKAEENIPHPKDAPEKIVPEPPIDLPKVKTGSEKILAAIESQPTQLATAFLVELCRKFLEPAQITELEASLSGLSPIIDHLGFKVLNTAEAPNETVKILINQFLDLLGQKEESLTHRQRQQALIPIIKKIVDNSIDGEFVQLNAEKVKAASLDYPGLNLVIGPLVSTAFSPFFIDFFKIKGVKLAASKGIEYFLELKPEKVNQKAEIYEHTNKLIELLVPILDRLNHEYQLVEQYKVAQEIVDQLQIVPLNEEAAISHIKPLVTQTSLQNFSRFYLPFYSILSPILGNFE